MSYLFGIIRRRPIHLNISRVNTYPYSNTIISGNPQIWGYTPKLGGDTPKFGGVTPKFGGVTPKFGGDQKDKFQKFEKKFIGKIKEYYFVLFPQ